MTQSLSCVFQTGTCATWQNSSKNREDFPKQLDTVWNGSEERKERHNSLNMSEALDAPRVLLWIPARMFKLLIHLGIVLGITSGVIKGNSWIMITT